MYCLFYKECLRSKKRKTRSVHAETTEHCYIVVSRMKICSLTERDSRPGGGGVVGTPIWNRRGCLSEILNLTPKGVHLGMAQAFCDP